MVRRPKTISVGTLNIVLHPHSPDLYEQIFSDAKRLKIAGIINSNRRARIGHLETMTTSSGQRALYGYLYFFTALNPDAPWLDDEANKAADEERIAALRSNLQDLHPEFSMMRFFVNLNKHKIVFEVKDDTGTVRSPNTILKAFTSMFRNTVLVETFGEAKLTIVPKKDALDTILKIPKLKKLYIDLSPPNTDGWEEEASELESRLDDIGAKRLEVTITKSASAKTIEPDEELLKLARVAQINGKVEGTGVIDGKTVVESTESHPKIDSYMLYHDQSAFDKFKEIAAIITGMI